MEIRFSGIRDDLIEGDFAFMFLISFFFVILSQGWHQYQSLTVADSSVVGAPWRRGVLTTQAGTAGFGLGHRLRREHDSTPESGVEPPRLLQRSLPRL